MKTNFLKLYLSHFIKLNNQHVRVFSTLKELSPSKLCILHETHIPNNLYILKT